MLGMLSVAVEALSGRTPQGWASLMVVTLLLSGVQLIILGVVGEYLGRLFLSINHKPQFVIRDITRNGLASRVVEADVGSRVHEVESDLDQRRAALL